MNESLAGGINRHGLDQSFATEETHKSELLLSAQLLRSRGQLEEAAVKLAEAALIEEKLSERCATAGLREKGWVHQFSAAGCWAQAGNFYQAITICAELLAQPELAPLLRTRVQDYAQLLRARRAQWYADLDFATAAADA
jgi:hypothetical protein